MTQAQVTVGPHKNHSVRVTEIGVYCDTCRAIICARQVGDRL